MSFVNEEFQGLVGGGGSNSLYGPPSGNVKIQKLIAKHIFECFEKRKGGDGKK